MGLISSYYVSLTVSVNQTRMTKYKSLTESENKKEDKVLDRLRLLLIQLELKSIRL